MSKIMSQVVSDGVAPSVRKIQSVVTDVIDKFKQSNGYIPSKNVLERTPDADMFSSKYIGKPENSYAEDVTLHTYTAPDGTIQELASFKGYLSGNYCVERNDYLQGKPVRHIFSDDARSSLTEYEYSGGKLIKETAYEMLDGYSYKTVKTINPENGSYTKELIYDKDGLSREIRHYNAKSEKIQVTRIEDFNGIKYTTNEIFDPKTRKIVGIECEELNSYHFKEPTKFIQKCEIDPETGKISKFVSLNPYGSVRKMFERDKYGTITHIIDNTSYNKPIEYKYNPNTGVVTMNGEVSIRGCINENAYIEEIKYYLQPGIEKYL